jgi:hypothetical protein
MMNEKPILHALIRDDPATPEGKYLVKRRDGTVVEWPSFVLGARDPAAPYAIRAYARAGVSLGFDIDFCTRLMKLADEFDAYRAEYGVGDPDRGLHRKDDAATVAEMRKGRSS